MTDLQPVFLYFLRQGLGKIDSPYTGKNLSATDWKILFAMAHFQAVTGIFIDGVAHSSMRPPQSLWDQWILHLLYLEQMNERLIACGNRWQSLLQKCEISSALFKGASVATWYPNPLHRSIGDVDLVITNGWNQLSDRLHANDIAYRIESGDFVITDQELTIELHPTWEYFYNPFLNARLQRMLKGQQTLTNELYFVCLIIHLRRHFLVYGVGLKQLADIVVMLQSANLDLAATAKLLHHFHIEKFSRYLFGFLKSNFYLDKKYPLVPITTGYNYRLFQHVVWEDGFRLKFERDKKSKATRNSGMRILKNSIFWNLRGIRLLGLMPYEVFSFLLVKIVRRVKYIFIM